MIHNEQTELANCKYCNSEAELRQLGRIGNHYVSCTKCNNQTIGYDTIEEAILYWNTEQLGEKQK